MFGRFVSGVRNFGRSVAGLFSRAEATSSRMKPVVAEPMQVAQLRPTVTNPTFTNNARLMDTMRQPSTHHHHHGRDHKHAGTALASSFRQDALVLAHSTGTRDYSTTTELHPELVKILEEGDAGDVVARAKKRQSGNNNVDDWTETTLEEVLENGFGNMLLQTVPATLPDRPSMLKKEHVLELGKDYKASNYYGEVRAFNQNNLINHIRIHDSSYNRNLQVGVAHDETTGHPRHKPRASVAIIANLRSAIQRYPALGKLRVATSTAKANGTKIHKFKNGTKIEYCGEGGCRQVYVPGFIVHNGEKIPTAPILHHFITHIVHQEEHMHGVSRKEVRDGIVTYSFKGTTSTHQEVIHLPAQPPSAEYKEDDQVNQTAYKVIDTVLGPIDRLLGLFAHKPDEAVVDPRQEDQRSDRGVRMYHAKKQD